MKAKTLVMAVGLAVVALGSIEAANATAMLQITQGAGGGLPGPLAGAVHREAIGDNGGTHYPSAPSAVPVAGAGLPTINGGWPSAPGFAVDTGLPPGAGNLGISGWDQSYLNLTEAANVTFQFMGKGDSIDHNQFQLYLGGVWTTIFDTKSGNGTCGASGSFPVIDCSPAGSSVTEFLTAGLIPFRFQNLTTPATATNNGTGNPADIQGSFFLGIDPYLASGAFQNVGTAAYAGFTDLACTGAACDHDYEDMIVRASVPEPGTVFLLGIGMLGVASSLRRRKV